jgi:hypothetical protein
VGLVWTLKYQGDLKYLEHYHLLVFDYLETIYLSQNIKDTSVVINLANYPATDVILKVIMIDKYLKNYADEKLIDLEKGILARKVSPEKAAEITEKLQKICLSADVNMNKLITARYFEEEGLFMNVIAIYKLLIEANPNEKKYEKLYQNFLIANGFN